MLPEEHPGLRSEEDVFEDPDVLRHSKQVSYVQVFVDLILTFLEGCVQLETLSLQAASEEAAATLRNAKGIEQ